ncbi:MAG: hypothetical protein IPJ88_10380 [Myxococcales bacterium]|nr:MAG: hypothetical protein IPJ88_10380 [Myxococcales bacterium]
MNWSVAEQIREAKQCKPHVVILGAGASAAAFPNGDKNGRKLPVMSNLVETVGLGPVLKKHEIPFRKNQNFERLYATLLEQQHEATSEIEDLIRCYFSKLQLPEQPTLYDHLVISLREKDLIATFNWDPFLFQATERNCAFTKPPQTAFLHGCVALGVDHKNKIFGHVGRISSKGQPFAPSRLLYPINKKDYSSDPFIKDQWNQLKHSLEHAFVLSIFGYSAPSSDVEAKKLMQSAWGNPETRQFEEIEIIDIKGKAELRKTWDSLICSHHYETSTDFYNSILAHFPRRSVESIWNTVAMARVVQKNPIPRHLNFDDLYQWFKPLLNAETTPSDC